MRRWGWISVIVLVLFGTGMVWFWSLAALPPETTEEVTLKVERAPVSVQLPDESSFHDATNGMTLPVGSKLKTGDGGRATIAFFHQAESRMDANTELTITEASQGEDISAVRIALDVTAGNIWSRVLRLLDLEDAFLVQTPSVIATARGTAFDVRANTDGGSEVWVFDSAVTVIPRAAKDVLSFKLPDAELRMTTGTPAVAEGEGIGVDAKGALRWRRSISNELRASRWVTENTASDELFLRSEQERRWKELERLDGIRPDQFGWTFMHWSEGLHLVLAGSNQSRLAERYLIRRLGHLLTMAQFGKDGRASQEFARLESDLKSQFSEDAERNRLRTALGVILPLTDDAMSGSALYPFKQRLEDLAISLEEQEEDRTDALFSRLLAADARLSEAVQFLDDARDADARTALDAARNGIGNVRREAMDQADALQGDRRDALSGELIALAMREHLLRERLGARPVITEETATSTEMMATEEEGGEAEESTAAITAIRLRLQPNAIQTGERSTVRVFAIREDETAEDVTTQSTIRVLQGAGSLTGSTFTSTEVGSTTLEAAYTVDEHRMTAQATISVRAAETTEVALSRLEATADQTSLGVGANTSLHATAVYADGTTKTVTSQVVWSNLTPARGTVSGSAFTATSAGTVELKAMYEEGGVTKEGRVYLTVK